MAGRKTVSRKTKTRASSRATKAPDAVQLLKADHRQVEDWFAEFEKARSDSRKSDLASKICTALKVHTLIEEEIFYPAFMEATEDEDMHHEAIVEHDGAKKLIAEIEASGPQDEYYDAKVKVLSEMIKHHVNEEEKLAARKKQAMAEMGQAPVRRRAFGRLLGREARP
jgi:hemerythrin superfamily protein